MLVFSNSVSAFSLKQSMNDADNSFLFFKPQMKFYNEPRTEISTKTSERYYTSEWHKNKSNVFLDFHPHVPILSFMP